LCGREHGVVSRSQTDDTLVTMCYMYQSM
jgi:hypothetical protein